MRDWCDSDYDLRHITIGPQDKGDLSLPISDKMIEFYQEKYDGGVKTIDEIPSKYREFINLKND